MYVREGEIRLELGSGETDIASAGAAVTLPHGNQHTWQVLSDEACFLTINAGRHTGASFDQFVAALGTPTDPNAMPDPIEIDPEQVASMCAEQGLDVLGPPPLD